MNKNGVVILLRAFFSVIIFSIFFASFQNNYFKFADQQVFSVFQKDSESFVIGGIVADKFHLEKGDWNLGGIGLNGVYKYPESLMDAYTAFADEPQSKDMIFEPYRSQYGVQGIIFSWLNKMYVFKDLSDLHGVSAGVFIIVIMVLSFLYSRIYGYLFAFVFLLTMVSSPWIISFAKNLYWVPVLWFLPALFAAFIYVTKNSYARVFYVLCIVLSVFIKSLAGYEYLSTITLFACSVFCIGPFFNSNDSKPKENFILFVLVFSACVIGFVLALLIHAGMRGDSVYSGLMNIIDQDVKRRTYADSSSFGPALAGALSSSPFTVVSTYIKVWATPLVFWLPGEGFKYLIMVVIFGLSCKSMLDKSFDKKYLVMVVYFFFVPVSWFVLAKGHSFVHTHMNYVLWYFGFVQSLLYVLIILSVDLVKTMNRKKFAFCGFLFVSGLSIYYLAENIKQSGEFDSRLEKIVSNSKNLYSPKTDFEVYLTQAGEVIYFKNNCTRSDVSNEFFLHAFHEVRSSEIAIGSIEGFKNLDFSWDEHKVSGPGFFSKYRGSCMAIVTLPNFYIERISTGQFDLRDPAFPRFWQADIGLGLFRAKNLSPLDISDSNWVNGVSRYSASFFLENNFTNRQSIKLQTSLVFSFSKKRKVIKIDYTENYINILLDGSILDENFDGYPNKILVDEM